MGDELGGDKLGRGVFPMDEALRDVLGLSLSECHELAFGESLKLSLGEARNPAEVLGDELGDELYMQVQGQQNSHYGFWARRDSHRE